MAFALGMYLPMELNTPVLLGGILSWMVARRREGEDDATVKARTDRGVLLASGLMAGGAIIGAADAITSAIIKQVTGSTAAKMLAFIRTARGCGRETPIRIWISISLTWCRS